MLLQSLQPINIGLPSGELVHGKFCSVESFVSVLCLRFTIPTCLISISFCDLFPLLKVWEKMV